MGGRRSNMELVWPPMDLLQGCDPVTQQLLGGQGGEGDLVSLFGRGKRPSLAKGGQLTAPSAQTESAEFAWTVEVGSSAAARL